MARLDELNAAIDSFRKLGFAACQAGGAAARLGRHLRRVARRSGNTKRRKLEDRRAAQLGAMLARVIR